MRTDRHDPFECQICTALFDLQIGFDRFIGIDTRFGLLSRTVDLQQNRLCFIFHCRPLIDLFCKFQALARLDQHRIEIEQHIDLVGLQSADEVPLQR